MIVKLHGHVERREAADNYVITEDNYVITEDNYIDYLTHTNLDRPCSRRILLKDAAQQPATSSSATA